MMSAFGTIKEIPLWFWIGLASVAMFFGSILLAWFMIVHLPSDYFTNPDSRKNQSGNPLVYWVRLLAANLFGLALLVAGLIMIFTPGQGVMFIILGIAVMNFPGKKKLLRRMLSNQKTLQVINRIRHKAGKQPLKTDHDAPPC